MSETKRNNARNITIGEFSITIVGKDVKSEIIEDLINDFKPFLESLSKSDQSKKTE